MKHIVTFIILICFSAVFGQKIEKELYLKHTLRQENLSYSFKVMDPDLKLPKYKKEKFYFWFKTQKVIVTQGGASGSLLHGSFEAFYDTKQLAQKGEFKKGLKDGEWIYWRQNGSILHTEEWDNGVLSGKKILYNNEGVVTETIEYKRNSFTRRTADSLVISNPGKKKETVHTFDNMGNVKTKAQFENGKREGKTKYYEQGKLVKTEVYHKDQIEVKENKEKPETKDKRFFFGKKKTDSKNQEKKPEAKKKLFGKKSEKSSKPVKNKKSGKKQTNKEKEKGKKKFFDFLKPKNKGSR